jgi:hypothetical protein
MPQKTKLNSKKDVTLAKLTCVKEGGILLSSKTHSQLDEVFI